MLAGAWDETVNVVDDRLWRVADLLDRICAADDLPPVHWSGPTADAPSLSDRRISNRRLHNLGYPLLHPTAHSG